MTTPWERYVAAKQVAEDARHDLEIATDRLAAQHAVTIRAEAELLEAMAAYQQTY